MRTRSCLTVLACIALGMCLSGCGSSSEAIAMETSARTFVLPHMLETTGRVSEADQFNRPVHDTTLFVTYVGGIQGVTTDAQGGGATVTVHLFDEATGELTGAGQSPVATEVVQLDANQRKVKIDFEDLLTNAGAFSLDVIFQGFAVITVEGDDEHVGMQMFTANANASPHNVAVFGFTPQELTATE